MIAGKNKSIIAGLGPIYGNLGSPTGTAPLTGTGVLNLSNLSTTPTKVLSARASSAGCVRRCRLLIVSAQDVAVATVPNGATAPTIAADADGSADEGMLLMGGTYGAGLVEWFSVRDTEDLYIVAGAASTIVQLTVVEI